MIVCVCQAVSDREIRQWQAFGGRSFDQLQRDLGVATCCGACRSTASDMLHVRDEEIVDRAPVR